MNAHTNSSPLKALGPVYVPGVSEKYVVIMATPLEDVDPTMLGLPSGAVIKPASQVIVNNTLNHFDAKLLLCGIATAT